MWKKNIKKLQMNGETYNTLRQVRPYKLNFVLNNL